MICADIPGEKIRSLPKILSQAFTVPLIVYTEKNGSQAMKSVDDFKIKYKLFPPISGPSIERMLLRMIKEANAANAPDAIKKEARKSYNFGSNDENQTISIAGKKQSDMISISGKKKDEMISISGSTKNSQFNIVQKGKKGKEFDELLSLSEEIDNEVNELKGKLKLSSEDTENVEIDSTTNFDSNAFNENELDINETYSDSAFEADNNDNEPIYSAPEQTEQLPTPNTDIESGKTFESYEMQADSLNSNELTNQNEFGISTDINGNQSEEGANEKQINNLNSTEEDISDLTEKNELHNESLEDKSKLFNENEISDSNPTTEKSYESNIEKDDSDESLADPEEAAKLQKNAFEADDLNSSLNNYTKKKRQLYKKSKILGSGTNDSAFDNLIQAVENSLNQLQGETKPTTECDLVQNVENFYSMTINTDQYKGYLTLKLSSSLAEDFDLVQIFKSLLKKQFSDLGLNENLEQVLEVNIQPIEAQDWFLKAPTFSRSRLYKAGEIVVCYFDNQEVTPVIETHAEGKMTLLAHQNIEEGPIGFNLYLYLPKNKKFIHYKKPQDKIPNQFVSQLTSTGVDKVFFLHTELQLVKNSWVNLYFHKIKNQLSRDSASENAA